MRLRRMGQCSPADIHVWQCLPYYAGTIKLKSSPTYNSILVVQKSLAQNNLHSYQNQSVNISAMLNKNYVMTNNTMLRSDNPMASAYVHMYNYNTIITVNTKQIAHPQATLKYSLKSIQMSVKQIHDHTSDTDDIRSDETVLGKYFLGQE